MPEMDLAQNPPARRKATTLMRGTRFLFIAVFLAQAVVHAGNLDTIGVTLLRAVTTNLNGTGIRVAQPEATVNSSGDYFEVNPSAVGVSSNWFYYVSDLGTATNFPNSVGNESGHADAVAGNFYGPAGVATNVAHVDNWFADEFVKISETVIGPVTNYTVTLPATNIDDPVVNQSFILGTVPVGLQQACDSSYDNYAAQYKTLFASGAGNGGPVYAPSTCYNGISVGVSDGSSSYGPTPDNGRCKPDLIAPGGATSYSTPLVAGAAAVLMQAGLRGDGGSDTNSAADIRMVKALLLNGAVKPAAWTNSPSSPLHPLYGAGVLDVFNSYEQLAGGKHDYVVSTTVSTGGAHPPTSAAGTVGALNGWDFNTDTSGSTPFSFDAINHYYFNVTNAVSNAVFTLTATLVWERQIGQSAINDLNLFLYNCANSNLVACSTSLVDNVEHVFVPALPTGRYDLQVWKAGGSGIVSTAESYALAWTFFPEQLTAMKSGGKLALSWPLYPDGFHVEATASLTTPNWGTNNIPAPVFTNSQNVLTLGATNSAQFFRLRTP